MTLGSSQCPPLLSVSVLINESGIARLQKVLTEKLLLVAIQALHVLLARDIEKVFESAVLIHQERGRAIPGLGNQSGRCLTESRGQEKNPNLGGKRVKLKAKGMPWLHPDADVAFQEMKRNALSSFNVKQEKVLGKEGKGSTTVKQVLREMDHQTDLVPEVVNPPHDCKLDSDDES
jgi:hypothetical protein